MARLDYSVGSLGFRNEADQATSSGRIGILPAIISAVRILDVVLARTSHRSITPDHFPRVDQCERRGSAADDRRTRHYHLGPRSPRKELEFERHRQARSQTHP